MPHPATLSVQDAHKSYGAVRALKGINCELTGGQVIALLGANGSGKTTLVRAIAGLHQLDQGTIAINGHAAGSIAARRGIGVMLQDASPPETLKVGELITLFRGYYDAPLALADTLRMADLTALEHRRYGKLSGGERRRVQFALSICGNPGMIILDEPTVHMDGASRDTFRASLHALRQQGKLIVLVSHQMEEIEALAGRVLVIHQGVLIGDGSMDEVRKRFGLSRITCRSTLEPAILDRLDEVVSWTRDDAQLTLLTRDRDRALRALLQADASASEVAVEPAPLDEAIAAMVQQAAGQVQINRMEGGQ